MKRLTLVLIAGSLIFAACGRSKPNNPKPNGNDEDSNKVETVDSNRFDVDSVHVSKRGEGCDTDEGCAMADLYFEKIKEPLLPVHDSVNAFVDEINKWALNQMSDSDLPVDLEQRADDFIASYDEFKDESAGWDWTYSTQIAQYFNEVITVHTATGGYTGGAHPNYEYYSSNFWTESGELVKLEDLVSDMAKLTEIGEQYFRRDLQIPDDQTLNDYGFEFPDDKFELNDNFEFTKNKIVFTFNAYEVAPYVMGTNSVAIPIKDIEDILKVELNSKEGGEGDDYGMR